MRTPDPGSGSPEDLSGQQLASRYRISERIGQGGMATVYLATDQHLGREVAVKVFHRGLTSPADLQRQSTEVRHLAGLTHPALVTLYDASSDDAGRSFLVLEYVPGRDLRSRLANGPLPPDVVAAIGRDIARALAYVHSRNVVHRDVSPGNILLPLEDHGVAAKLSDLGIARVVDAAQVTVTGTMIGTAAYLSPEQVRGEQVSTSTDIYSLGLVLLEALTGDRAFPGPASQSALVRLTRDPEIPDIVPLAWRDLLAAMTARDADDRPSAVDVAQSLASDDLGMAVTQSAPLTNPRDDLTRENVTRLLEQPSSDSGTTMVLRPASGSLRPEALGRLASRWRGIAAVAALVIFAVVVLLIALPGGQKTSPPPTYPSVPGQLGADLKQLEQAVSPQGTR